MPSRTGWETQAGAHKRPARIAPLDFFSEPSYIPKRCFVRRPDLPTEYKRAFNIPYWSQDGPA